MPLTTSNAKAANMSHRIAHLAFGYSDARRNEGAHSAGIVAGTRTPVFARALKDQRSRPA